MTNVEGRNFTLKSILMAYTMVLTEGLGGKRTLILVEKVKKKIL